MSKPAWVNAVRPPAAQLTLRAVQAGNGWLGQLVPLPESMSLWLWMCDHGHPDDLEAVGCAYRERDRLAGDQWR